MQHTVHIHGYYRSELDSGAALALDTVRRLCCDGSVLAIVEGTDGEPLSVGRKTRSIPLPRKRALRSRDGGCRFPGCDRTRFTEGHHVRHWADRGETKLSNLVTVCGFHHRLLHEGGYGLTATDDGVCVFTKPDGRRIPECGTAPTTVPQRQRFSGSAGGHIPNGSPHSSFEDALRAYVQTSDPALRNDAETSRCKWLGEAMDYSVAVEGLEMRDRRAHTLCDSSTESPLSPHSKPHGVSALA